MYDMCFVYQLMPNLSIHDHNHTHVFNNVIIVPRTNVEAEYLYIISRRKVLKTPKMELTQTESK